MEKQSSKLRSNEAQEIIAGQQQQQSQTAREFADPEALLRYDAAQTPVPPEIQERLRDAISREPPPCGSWWQRWFGRKES